MPAGTHPQDAAAYLGSDMYRLTSASGTGYAAYLKNALTTAKFGESVSVPVYIERGAGSGSVTLKAVSETDPTKTASAVCTLSDSTVGGSVPATLALTMGAPASFGPFTPGLGKDYFATTSANVISTAGDATLASPTRARPPPAIWSTARSRSRRPAGLGRDRGHVCERRRLVRADHAEDLERPGLQRPRLHQLQADDRVQRRAAHGHVREDTDLHALTTTP